MCFVQDERHIIILTGRNVVGKTTAANYLRELATSHNIPYENRLVADSQFLFEAMLVDDKTDGFHHTHDWCVKDSKGHTHRSDDPEFPFTVTDNELPNTMHTHFFTRLTELPSTSRLWLVEWAAGVNTNPLHDPASFIDYSYAKVNRMLRGGTLPAGWLKKVYAVIHLTAHDFVRFSLNERRSRSSGIKSEALEKGTAFWFKDDRVLRFYGRDDFPEIEGLFQKVGIPIYPVVNDGDVRFYEYLERIANTLFFY